MEVLPKFVGIMSDYEWKMPDMEKNSKWFRLKKKRISDSLTQTFLIVIILLILHHTWLAANHAICHYIAWLAFLGVRDRSILDCEGLECFEGLSKQGEIVFTYPTLDNVF